MRRTAVLRCARAGTGAAAQHVRTICDLCRRGRTVFSKEVDMFSHRDVHGFRHTEPLVIGFLHVIVSFLAVEVGPEPW